MEPFQQRVIEEKKELDQKLLRLRKFFEGQNFQSVDPNEQARMLRQEVIMTDYSSILEERINAFE